MRKARIVAKNIQTLTYNFSEDSSHVVEELAKELETVYTKYYERLPNKEGLILCPTSQQSMQYIRQKVQKAKATLRCSTLPQRKYGRKRAHPVLRRFGRKADKIRKTLVSMIYQERTCRRRWLIRSWIYADVIQAVLHTCTMFTIILSTYCSRTVGNRTVGHRAKASTDNKVRHIFGVVSACPIKYILFIRIV